MTSKRLVPDPQPELAAIDTRRLQLFVVSAQTLNFATAAQRLNLVPSAVSHAIKALEEDLGCGLFQRNGPKVTMTRAGVRLLPFAEDLLNRMAVLRKEVGAIKGESRRLKVMMPEYFCSSVLPAMLPDFAECFPAIDLQVLPCEGLETSMEALTSGETDMLVWFSTGVSGDVVRRDLFSESLGLYVAPFHPLARAQEVDTTMFQKNILLVADAECHRLATEKLVSEPGGQSRIWRLPSVDTIRELARVGWGVAMLTESAAATSVAAGTLKKVEHLGQPLRRTSSAYWMGRLQPSWADEVFLSLLAMAGDEMQEKLLLNQAAA